VEWVGACLIAGAVFVACSAAAQQSGSAPGTRAVLLGDSITAGIMSGSDPGLPYAELLGLGLADRVDVIGIGCSGSSTTDWTLSAGSDICDDFLPATLFESLAIPNLPADFLTILLGTNDSVGFLEPAPVSPALYRRNLEETIGLSLFYGARTIVLMTPPPRCNPDTDAYRRLEAYRLHVFDICTNNPDVLCGPDLFTLLGDDDFEGCDVHPNAQGHLKIALALGGTLVQHAPVAPAIEVFHWYVPSSWPAAGAVFPVVVYSDPTFDAATEVDAATLTFGATGWEDTLLRLPDGSPACSAVDVDGDGSTDLACGFRAADSGLDLDSTTAFARGRLHDGTALDADFAGTADSLAELPGLP